MVSLEAFDRSVEDIARGWQSGRITDYDDRISILEAIPCSEVTCTVAPFLMLEIETCLPPCQKVVCGVSLKVNSRLVPLTPPPARPWCCDMLVVFTSQCKVIDCASTLTT